MKPWPYPLWIAHRGAGKLAPENTLAAFRLGAQHGYRMFECDVKLSADDVPFLLHDPVLERTTNGRGIAGSLSWQQLTALDAGSWHSSAFAGERLPSLADVARFCLGSECLLNIEIKPTPGTEERTGKIVANEAAKLWADAATPPLLTSFIPQALQAAREAQAQLPRGLLLDALWTGWLEVAQKLECVAIVCDQILWDANTVAQVKNAGLHCLAYTVNEETAAQALLTLGVDGIITDRVDLFAPSSAAAKPRM